jgi:hypothetical protein
MLRSYWHNGKQALLYFYRDKDQKEIDVLIVRDGRGIRSRSRKHSSRGAMPCAISPYSNIWGSISAPER